MSRLDLRPPTHEPSGGRGETMRTFTIAAVATCLLTGCGGPDIWDKAGANQTDFQKDSYGCERDARMSAASFGTGLAAALNAREFYRKCMVAQGYTLRQGGSQSNSNNPEVEAGLKAILARQAATCGDPKFSPYYTKTACTANKISFEQLTDATKISPGAKAIFVELRATVDAQNAEAADFLRKHGGPVGAKQADLYTTAKVQNDKNNVDLFNGAITWGEYNKRRQQIHADYLEAERKLRP